MEEMNNSAVNFTTSEASTSQLINGLFILVGSISFLFGLPTNVYVIWLIITGTGSGVASEFFNLNLSVCEIGVCLNSLTFILSVWFSSFKLVKLFLLGLTITGRSLFQCLMCVERYLAVVHPVTFLKFKPLRYRVICSSVAWIAILGSCLFSMFILAPLDDKEQTVSWFFSLQFLLFLFIQLFFLVAVLRALKQSGPGERGREREEENHMKRRAFHLILITTVNTTVIYVPNVVYRLIFLLTQQDNHALLFTGLICYLLAGFVQPVLYLHRTGKLRSCIFD